MEFSEQDEGTVTSMACHDGQSDGSLDLCSSSNAVIISDLDKLKYVSNYSSFDSKYIGKKGLDIFLT